MHIRKTHPLVQRFWLWSSLVVFVVGMLVEAPRTAARDVKGGPASTCTVENVAGVYGFLGSGTVLQDLVGHPAGMTATVGILTFDGQWQWRTTNQSLTANGQVTSELSVTGTYTVKPNGTDVRII